MQCINTTQDYRIRQIEASDLSIIKAWMIEEGWDPGQYDVDVYYQHFPNDFFVTVNSQQKLLGCILAPRYEQNFGFIGLFIVHRDFRGQHIGRQLWNYVIEYHLYGREVKLYAVQAQVNRYREWGNFQVTGTMQRYRNEHLVVSYKSPTQNNTGQEFESAHDKWELGMKNFLSRWITEFKRMDSQFVTALLTHEQMSSVRMNNEEGQMVGFAVLRPCYAKDYRLSLFANTVQTAAKLTEQVVRQVKDDRENAAPQERNESDGRGLNIFMDAISLPRSMVCEFAKQMNFSLESDVAFQVMRRDPTIKREIVPVSSHVPTQYFKSPDQYDNEQAFKNDVHVWMKRFDYMGSQFIMNLLTNEQVSVVVKKNIDGVVEGLALLQPRHEKNDYQLCMFSDDEESTVRGLTEQILRQANFDLKPGKKSEDKVSYSTFGIFMGAIQPPSVATKLAEYINSSSELEEKSNNRTLSNEGDVKEFAALSLEVG
ncbi:MAG: GNAT family N-acetyltransferase [Legionellales bacterium]|nr:GNAT family N-acetyltransferase [Legionellales bacterium]